MHSTLISLCCCYGSVKEGPSVFIRLVSMVSLVSMVVASLVSMVVASLVSMEGIICIS